VEAHAGLLDRLADKRHGKLLPNEARAALSKYNELTRRDLVQPLQRWVLVQTDLAVRAAGLELANVCSLLHQLSFCRLGPTAHR